MARAVLGGLATFQFTCFLAFFVICSLPNACHSHKKGPAFRSTPRILQNPLALQFNLDSSDRLGVCLGKLQRQSLTEMLQNLVVVHFQNAEVRVIVDVGQG